ncbi:MAG TPA: type II toxin-antitoxin system HigB family toxin [Armatimonadota bacterium]
MNVISPRTLRAFWQRHADAERPLLDWYNWARRAEWHTSQDIKAEHPEASFLPGDRVVFNIKGNAYRLVVHVRYSTRRVYVRFVGTHAEYDRIDATRV